MFYEVQIPSTDLKTQRTFQIEASSWRSALMTGMAQTSGNTPPSLAGFFVDLRNDGVLVTDPHHRRVIRIRSLDDSSVRQSQALKALTGQFVAVGGDPRAASGLPSASAPAPAPTPGATASDPSSSSTSQSVRAVGYTHKATGAFRPIVSTEIRKSDLDATAGARILQDTFVPVAPTPEAVADPSGAVEPLQEADGADVTETALEDVFLEIMSLFEPDLAMEDAIDFVLDLATRYIPCTTGGLMFAADTADHLYFAAARGTGKKKLLKAEISIREGVPAASLKDGRAIAVTNAASDPRHTSELADKSGVSIDSVCCAPIQSGDRGFGVMLLINRKERSFFSQYDANILSYIGAQMGKYIQDQVDSAPLE